MKRYTSYAATGLAMMLICLFSCGCQKSAEKEVIIIPEEVPAEDLNLQKNLPFPIGAAVGVGILRNNAPYRAVVTQEFNSITPENAMKMANIHPGIDTYNWVDADYLVDYAIQNGKRVHGHTLNWYKNPPAWVTTFQGDAAAWENLLKTHIQTVVAHYKGKVASWDVVNEALNDDGTYRNSIWVEKLGVGYIGRCFEYAHEADPAALLFYNDYGHEYGPTKRNAILKLVTDLKDKGIPIHGIGMQMHTRVTRPDADLKTAIETAAATGLKVHIAELDIAMNPDNDQTMTFTPARAAQQAQKYKFIVKSYYAIPKAQQFGITTWNVADADSWIPSQYKRPDWPLPFDQEYKRKPAHQGILDGVK